MSDHWITFEAHQINDENFFTKFGYQVDTRVFRWLQQCQQEEDRENVDDDLINFKPLVQAVLNDQFLQVLPCTFKTKRKDDEEQDTNRPRNKKRTEGNQAESRVDKNTGRLPAWIQPMEVYQQKFAGTNLSKRPQFHGRPMCHRYHSKGHCFSDCINAVTHIPSNTITADANAAYANYCQECIASK